MAPRAGVGQGARRIPVSFRLYDRPMVLAGVSKRGSYSAYVHTSDLPTASKSDMVVFRRGQSDRQELERRCNDGRATMQHRMLIRLLFIVLMSGC